MGSFIGKRVRNYKQGFNGRCVRGANSLLQQAGYHSHIEQVNTADYWLPQRRPRVYIFALHHSRRADNHWVPILHNLLSALKGAAPLNIAEVFKA